MTPGQIYRQRAFTALAEQYDTEIAEVESRKGELPKRDLTELRLLREQIDAARTERTTAKETLVATRTEQLDLKATLQAQLDAAVGKSAKDPIRLQIDECNAKLEQARLDLDAADGALESLRLQRDELLLDERITKDETTVDDEPKITARKEQQAKDLADKKAWRQSREKAVE